MRLFLIKVATITIIIKLQCCTAQLFPWSNLKQYFDQKTKHGPGNGGVLNISPDLNDPDEDKISSAGDRPYRNTDSGTSFSINNGNKRPVNVHSEWPDTTTVKDITKQILKNNKNKNHKINLNLDTYQPQDHYPTQNFNNDDKENSDRHFNPILSINQDSTIRPHYNYNNPKNQNINIHLTNSPDNVYKEDTNYESESQDTIVITQKPIVIQSHTDNKSQNNRISHKTVSIIPSINVKTQSFNDNQPIYVTSRPPNYPATQTKIKIKEFSSTHRPIKQTPINIFRPRPEYHTFQNDNPIFLPTVPPTISILPKINSPKPPPSLDGQYINSEPDPPKRQQLFVETVPSLAIQIKASGNKPFRITDGNSGLVDYLVPPPLPSSQPIKLQSQSLPTRSSVFGTKQKRKPDPSIAGSSLDLIRTDSASYINTEDDLKIMNEMSKLKPPEKVEETYVNNNNKKLMNKKKLQNYINLLKHQQQLQQLRQQQQQEQLQQSNYDDSGSVYENVKNLQQERRLPRKKLEGNKPRNVSKRNKYHNHKMPSNAQLRSRNNNNDNDYEYKEDKSENENTAASQINEQITAEAGFSQPNSNGDRVEFQMHGQNGPKSYKFGFDTGKGHNRQFRYEERDRDGFVKGHYGYYDKDGKLQVVNYEADPHTGFKADPIPV